MGQLGKTVTWIGGTLSAESDGIRATVKEAIVPDIREDLAKLLKQNAISTKELHSLVGKLWHAAGLLVVMRPLLQALWAYFTQR